MLEDRFYEPDTVPFDDLCGDAYEKYLENFDEDGEPMTYEQYEEYYWGRY